MAGHKPFRLLREKMSPERLAASDARVQATLREMRLAELRESLQTSQQQLDDLLDVKQIAVSEREDMPVGTLRKLINALGGDLELVARFPEGAIVLKGFDDANTSRS
ncbi:MAG: helix-turn-helix domain-containing protein [Pyrinomonadaceae bacterium MAG19_C2-C3]|nr:helix-turn-helix domain-containing protein [Pyrinomonadaceae bacterium MAG19_C2-C3]